MNNLIDLKEILNKISSFDPDLDEEIHTLFSRMTITIIDHERTIAYLEGRLNMDEGQGRLARIRRCGS